jgi:hypothetical protein
VRGRGYAMLPHEVRVPVARDGCDVDFTSSLGGRDDRCAPCTGYGAPDGGRRKSVIRPSYGIGSYVASLQTFSSRLSGRHRLSRVIRSLMLPWATRARSFAFGGVRGDRAAPGHAPGSIKKATLGAFAGTLAAHTKQSRF